MFTVDEPWERHYDSAGTLTGKMIGSLSARSPCPLTLELDALSGGGAHLACVLLAVLSAVLCFPAAV